MKVVWLCQQTEFGVLEFVDRACVITHSVRELFEGMFRLIVEPSMSDLFACLCSPRLPLSAKLWLYLLT